MVPGLTSAQRRAKNRRHGRKRPHARVRARPVIPGARLKLTRRCLERRFFLHPDQRLNQLIGYSLGYCLKKHGLQLHAACFMSNHYHLDVTDPHGNLTEFKAQFNGLLARAGNALRGRSDRFWSSDPACDVTILDDDDMVSRMAYTIANPTIGGLVRHAHLWPGFTTAGMRFGERRVYKQPDFFFDPQARRPARRDRA